MPSAHAILGFVVVALFGVVGAWGLLAMAFRRDPGRFFWWAVGFTQIAVGLQIVAGVVLLLLRYPLPKLLHLGYGVFAAIALVVAHVEARQRPDRPWVPFAWVGLIGFGLTLRALQTGLGRG